MQLFSGIHHFAISVASLADTIHWYQTRLGFELDYTYEFPPELKTKAAFLKSGTLRVEIFETEGADAMPDTRADFTKDIRVEGMKHIGLHVSDIDAVRAELERRGVEFVSPTSVTPNSGGSRWAFIHDNNGILIELFQPTHQPNQP